MCLLKRGRHHDKIRIGNFLEFYFVWELNIMKTGKKLLALLLCMVLCAGGGTAVLADNATKEIISKSTAATYMWDFDSESSVSSFNSGGTYAATSGVTGGAFSYSGAKYNAGKSTRVTFPNIAINKGSKYTVTGKVKTTGTTTLQWQICLNMDTKILQSTDEGDAWAYAYPNKSFNVTPEWTDFKMTVEVFDYVNDSGNSTGTTTMNKAFFLAPKANTPADSSEEYIVLLDGVKIVEEASVYAGDTVRTTVYQQDFSDGLGASFVCEVPMTASTKDAHIVMDAIATVDAAKTYATRYENRGALSGEQYTGKEGAWKGGRWGAEFLYGGLKATVGLTLKDGKNYKIEWKMAQVNTDGSHSKVASDYMTQLVLNPSDLYAWNSGQKKWLSNQISNQFQVSSSESQEKPGYWDYSWTIPASYHAGKPANATDQDTTFSGTGTLNSIEHRTTLIQSVAKIMAEQKLYCGKGTGAYNASGALQTTQPWGTGYTFTLSYDDFYGDETKGENGESLFNEEMSQSEKKAVMDSYIYEDPNADEKVLKTWSLAYDCSFLYSPTRFERLQKELEKFPSFLIDDYTITADAKIYKDTVTMAGEGTVTAVTNPVTNETATLTESGSVITNDYFGVTYKITPDDDYAIETVTYGGDPCVLNSSNEFTVDADSVTAGKTLNVVFKSNAPVAPTVTKTAAIQTGTYQDSPSAVVYVQVSAGSDGYSISKMGSFLDIGDDSLELTAKNTEGQDLTEAGSFGIRVYGDAFKGGTYFLKPFVTYRHGVNIQTAYADGAEFTLGTAEED